jgi:uncharacterized lipoprotein YehR (DUF1307 family)
MKFPFYVIPFTGGLRMIKRLVSLLLVLMLAITLAGCSGPPSDSIHNAVKMHLDEKYDSNIGEIISLDITNEYDKEIDGETIYTLEYEAQVKHHKDIKHFFGKDEEATYTGRVRLVERGNSWYSLG